MRSSEVPVVRTATTGDLLGLVKSDPYAREHPERCGLLAASIDRGECHAAFVGEHAVGYIVFNYSFFGRGFVPLVVVAPSMRRQGVAQLLFAAVMAQCQSESLFTSTNSSNIEAQRLLERLGFKRSGHIENLDDGDTELVYFKPCALAAAGANPCTAPVDRTKLRQK